MPSHKQIRGIRASMKPDNNGKLPLSVSSTASSHATISEDSTEDGKHSRRGTSYPVGTIVKKYFNGKGWVLGKIKNICDGEYHVKFDDVGHDTDELYSFTQSEIARLTKTANVRTGTKLAIHWPRERRYYTAVITKERPRKRENYLICYCHNTVEREWIDLHRHKFRVVVPSSPYNDKSIHKMSATPNSTVDGSATIQSNDTKEPPQEVQFFYSKDYESEKYPKDSVDCSKSFFTSKDIKREVSDGSKKYPGFNMDISINDQLCLKLPDLKQQKSEPVHLSPDSSVPTFNTAERVSLEKENTVTVTALEDSFNQKCCETGTDDVLSSQLTPQDHQMEGFTHSENKMSQTIFHPTLAVSHSPESTNQNVARMSSHKLDAGLTSQEPELRVFGEEKQVEDCVSNTAKAVIIGTELTSKVSSFPTTNKSPSILTYPNELGIATMLGGNTEQPSEREAVQVSAESKGITTNLSNDDDEKAHTDVSIDMKFGDVDGHAVRDVIVREDDGLGERMSSATVSDNDGEVASLPQMKESSGRESDDEPDNSRHAFDVSNLIAKIDVGSRVEVYWPEDRCYYAGIVTKKRKARNGRTPKRPFFLVYDDMEREWINFHEHKFRILEATGISDGKNKSHEPEMLGCSSDDNEKIRRTGMSDEAEEVSSNEKVMDCQTIATVECETKTEQVLPERTLIPGNQEGDKLTIASPNHEFQNEDDPLTPRRTSRSICPTKFYSKESESLMLPKMNTSDHVSVKDGRTEKESDKSKNSSLGNSNHSDSVSKLPRENRIAALNALVQKRKRKMSDAETDNDNADAKSKKRVKASALRQAENESDAAVDNDSRLKVGSRVSVMCNVDKKYYDGTIASEREHRKRYFVVYDDGKAQEWIDPNKNKFKMLKRKRGRPKKIREDPFEAKEIPRGKTMMEGSKRGRPKKNVQTDLNSVQHSSTEKKSFNAGPDTVKVTKVGPKSKMVEYTKSNKKVYEGAADIPKIDVGSRVAVLWANDGQYHEAIVTRKRSKDKPFYVEYDGEQVAHWIDFAKHHFKLLAEKVASETAPAKKKRGRPKKVITDNGDVAKIKVGSRVAIWWEGDAKYIAGTITKIRDRSKPFYLIYDDGEAAHWVDLEKHKFKFLEDDDSDDDIPLKRLKSEKQQKRSPKRPRSNKPSFENGTPTKANDISKVRIGSRIEVWWDRDSTYYPGTVKKVGLLSSLFFIRYDDDEYEWIDLRKHSFRFPVGSLHNNADNVAKKPPAPLHDDSDDSTISLSDSEEVEISTHEPTDGIYPDCDDDFVYGDVDKVGIGSRIAVWWPMDKVYYAGRVSKISEGRKPFFIEYDDDDEEWTDLRKRYFRILDK